MRKGGKKATSTFGQSDAAIDEKSSVEDTEPETSNDESGIDTEADNESATVCFNHVSKFGLGISNCSCPKTADHIFLALLAAIHSFLTRRTPPFRDTSPDNKLNR